MKILTISIAAYNVETTIEKALNTLLDSRILDKIEILVCDDGGTDRTLAIAKDYEVNYPGIVRTVHKENGGYGSVLNTNIALAKGKYFKQLDGDDSYITENLVEYVSLLSEIDADYVVTATMMNYLKTGGVKLRDCCGYMDEKLYDFSKTYFTAPVNMHSSTYRTVILKAMQRRFTEHCFYTDAELVTFPIPYIHTMYIWHKPIYSYNLEVSGQSVSRAGIKKHYKDMYAVFQQLLEVYKELRENEMTRSGQIFVRYWVVELAASYFKSIFLFFPSRKHYCEIWNFYNELDERCPDVLKDVISRLRTMKLFVCSHGLLYPFAVALQLGKYIILGK